MENRTAANEPMTTRQIDRLIACISFTAAMLGLSAVAFFLVLHAWFFYDSYISVE